MSNTNKISAISSVSEDNKPCNVQDGKMLFFRTNHDDLCKKNNELLSDEDVFNRCKAIGQKYGFLGDLVKSTKYSSTLIMFRESNSYDNTIGDVLIPKGM